MKTPRFEELAQRWDGKAEFYIVFSREAHPNAKGNERLNEFADKLLAMDADGDAAVSLAEYKGPRFMFDAFDVDRDEIVNTSELMASRRIDQFRGFVEPSNYEQRVAVAKRFRSEVPGATPVLIDTMDNRTSKTWSGLPNSAVVIAKGGAVSHKFGWASTSHVDAALAELTGEAAAPVAEVAIDWSPVEASLLAAEKSNRPLLVEFTAMGCGACKQMKETVLLDSKVRTGLDGYELAKLRIENDAAWALFEALELSGTPAFVIVDSDRTVRARVQGLQTTDAFLSFLGDEAR